MKKIGHNKRIPKLLWKMSKTLQHLRGVLENRHSEICDYKILEKAYEEVRF